MSQLSRQIGTTTQILPVFLRDSTSTTGAGKTGIAYNASGFTCYYKRSTAGTSTAVTLVSGTIGTYLSSGWVEVDSTHQPGFYEFCPPAAAMASGADWVTFYFTGATGMVPQPLLIDLTATSNQDGVRGGMSALPNAASATAGGLPTVDASNSVKVQAPLKKGVSAGFPFQMFDTSLNPKTGSTITTSISRDDAAFTLTSNSATELGNGWYWITFTATETNASVIVLHATATGAQNTDMTLLFVP